MGNNETGSIARLAAVVGPTGIGKSRLALHLAKEFDAEIVSADSRQLYRHMNIGTAKPTTEELKQVTHHLINIVEPDQSFSLAEYQELAYEAIGDIQRRNKLPLLVGGTGQYVKAVVEGWDIPRIPPDSSFRRLLVQRAVNGESQALYQELIAIDPDAAKKIDPRNIRRVIRALEVSKSSGTPFSRLRTKNKPPFKILLIGLTAARDHLYQLVDHRVEKMIEAGLIEEVKSLLEKGYNPDLPAMSGIGYRQIGEYLDGQLTLEEAVTKIKTETHRFIRHQYNWFRLNDQNILWFDIEKSDIESRIAGEIRQFVEAAN